ncbi:hypothetical protein [Streptomyces acidicola]|uniref:hypothetical protein n=1 Tax=Streptomyces acidicola TaxID=2596892 RepID=UPI003437EBAC
MTAPVMDATSARTLVDHGFFTRLSRRVANASALDQKTADAATDQALAYLATCAQKPAGAPSLFMSRAVDPAWHAFLEFTHQYDDFFTSRGWPKVHHNPCDGGPDGTQAYPPAAEVLPRTVAAIKDAGFRVVPELWTAEMSCGEGDGGDTCGDDGGGGNPLPTCEHSV